MKPLDFGGEGVTGSVNADGRIIALNFYHPQHGYVTLTAAEPFPEDQRHNPAAVRAYRAGLTEQEGFGVRFSAPITARQAALRESAIPEIQLVVAGSRVTVTTFACARGAVQRVTASGARWGGRLSLQRCAYTQLTEGGPLPELPLQLRTFCSDNLLVIHNPQLGAAVAIAGLESSECFEQETDRPLDLDFPLRGVSLVYGIGLTVEEAAANARWLLDHADDDAAAAWRALTRSLPEDDLVRRGIVYGKMMAIPVDEGICLLTDHMLLPLSWNRDAYFAARALLSAGQPDVVRRHLIWTFEQAERPGGAWARCYLANGRVKDGAFQLDQQLYPLLELADYLDITGDQETAARLAPHIAAVLAGLDARCAPDALLFPTDETPADDPIALPYHCSSHILLWHTLNKLRALGLAGSWAEHPPELRETIRRVFAAEHDGRQIYAYATDGIGHFHFYHDANDFPLALAPAWGFAPADDPLWRATIDFAFSDVNRGGFYDGHLGSVHSPAPWPLGDIQAMIIARARGDTTGAEKARATLRRVAQLDGALPEAYDAASGAVFSRHWFAWPGAALACLELGACG